VSSKDKRVKFGQLLPIPAAPIDSLIRVGVRTEKVGFDSVWAADHLLMIPTGIVPNVWLILSVIASQTERVELGKHVPDEDAVEFSIVGTPQDCANKVEEFVKARVRHFALVNLGPDPKFVLDVFARKIIPSYRS
jgi:alkanesulfonate monooxygenase SsuD/methylene tetrahydromethanopterin reductase-like flavin-dependent oxidoreductase (luciferase family)